MAAVQIMGILNVTPDSFSDGGLYNSVEAAVNQCRHLIESGADIIDIGGESTRPFAEAVSLSEELKRTIPVIQAIRREFSVPISIDTRNADVARRALEAGADILNDVSALLHDPDMINVVIKSDVPIIIMHMQKTPETMQLAPQYENVVDDICSFFTERLHWIKSKGVELSRIIIDPGIGFGKTLEHNLSILKHLKRFEDFGHPVLLGHSRKRFLGELTGKTELERDFATAVVAALAVGNGTSIIRVHNVEMVKTAITVAEAINSAA